MSFLSRWLRKPTSSSSGPASAPRSAPSNPVQPSPAKPSAEARAQLAAAEENTLRSAIENQDAQSLARLVVAGASTRIRQAAAAAVEDPDLLRQLIRDVRGGNDKNVYKILTAKRDALLDQARKREQGQVEVRAALDELKRHSQRAHDALFGSRLEEYEARWNAVADQADTEQRSQAQEWIERSRQTLAAHLCELAAQASREQAAAAAAEEARRLQEEQAQASAAIATEQARLIEEAQRAQAEQLQAEQRSAREIGELIRKARAALSAGSTSRATLMRRSIEEKQAGGPPLPAALASQLQQLDQQLDELKDWKNFSVTPKRAQLIEDMESLIGATLEPTALADKIKHLRDQWRALGKGAGTTLDPAVEADTQRFRDAANKAYEPCKEYFAAQALIRTENLQRREALLTRLTAFEASIHWEQADWQTVIRTLRDVRQEWRRCVPVDRDAGKQQQDAFSTLAASLQARVDAEYTRNLKQKEALIERARQLLASDDARKAIDAVKDLQQKWRTVGPVPRAADQALWEQFRQHCDAVFQKRQQEADAYAAALESNKTQALAVCEQIESIATLEGAELLARATSLADLRKTFESLGELPRAESRALRARLDQGLDRCAQAVARQHARDAERAWDAIFEAADQVRAYQLGVARGLDRSLLDTRKTSAESLMADTLRWPRNAADALKKHLADDCPADLAANEAALRMLCVRAELLADLPTPSEDQALRRDYQLQRLVQRMGQGTRSDEDAWNTLALEWLSVGPVDDAAYDSLVQRFRRCRERST